MNEPFTWCLLRQTTHGRPGHEFWDVRFIEFDRFVGSAAQALERAKLLCPVGAAIARTPEDLAAEREEARHE